jgi:hypothetical protein
MVSGADFAFGFRYGALSATEAAAAAVAGDGSDEHRHFPYARRLLSGWHRDQNGKWVPGQEDARLWEVFCRECGDTDGPAETQTEPVQHLRGPYPSEHKAKHAATKHFDEH